MDGALKIIRVHSHPVAVPAREMFDYDDQDEEEDEKEPWRFSGGSWKAPNPKIWARIGTMNQSGQFLSHMRH